MSKTWNFDQPLDDEKSTSSHEERAKIAALFHKQDERFCCKVLNLLSNKVE